MVVLLVANLANTVAEFAGRLGGPRDLRHFAIHRRCRLAVGSGRWWSSPTTATVERVFLSVSLVFVTYIAAAFLAHPDWNAVGKALLTPTFDLAPARCCC